jgi:hypothetical protein
MTKKKKGWRDWLDLLRSDPASASDFCRTVCSDFAEAQTPALSAAAKYFDLDVARPADAALLLRILADVSFGAQERGRPSGSKKWDMRHLFLLAVHLGIVRREMLHISDRKAVTEIKRRFPESYRYDDAKTIRQRLPAARQQAARLLKMGILEFTILRKKLCEEPHEPESPLTQTQIKAEALKMMETLHRDPVTRAGSSEFINMLKLITELEGAGVADRSGFLIWSDDAFRAA